MALIKCPDCKTAVSNKAAACPKRARPIKERWMPMEEIKQLIEARGMKKNGIISIFICVLLMSGGQGFCVEDSFKYQFARDYIMALGCLQDISDRSVLIKDDDSMMTLLAGANRNIIKSKEAISLIQTYEKPDKIAKFREEESFVIPLVVIILTEIQELNKEFLSQLEGLAKDDLAVEIKGGEAVPAATDNLLKTQLKTAEIRAQLEEAHKQLFESAPLIAYLLVDYPVSPDKPVLDMSLDEKKSLLHELELIFGDGVKEGMKTGQSYLRAAGALLYQALSQKYPNAELAGIDS